jgi:hypothetical protein
MRNCGVIRTVVSALIGCCALVASAADDLDALFDVGAPADAPAVQWRGYAEFSAARTYVDREHWSKLRGRADVAASGKLGTAAKWHIGMRVDVDGAYDLEDDFYPSAVRRNQRADFMIRETYLDASMGDWDFRLGRQHVVWGEMVGLFFADVVSARDMREFLLPEFEALRIPQWTARAEYFKNDTHLELIWIPVATVDEIGRPGADFYPFRVPDGVRIGSERKPDARLGNMNWGARLSTLTDGWDLSAFYYRSIDASPTFYPVAPLRFEARHDAIRQFGGTLAKDLGQFVLKSEVIYTRGRSFNTYSADPMAPFGMQRSNTLDYVVGADVPVGSDWRVNAQIFARTFFSHRDAMGIERHEPGGSILINRKVGDDFEAEILAVTGFNRTDYMLRPKVVWRFAPSWRGQFGLDVFGGEANGLFGRFDDADRAYVEARYDF